MSEQVRDRPIIDLLNEALELEGPERARFLDEVSTDNPALRQELESMLAAEPVLDDSSGGTLTDADLTETYPAVPGRTSRRKSAGDRIGPYRIVKSLGHGGMGTVYLGEQEEPVRRRVALKVIDAFHDHAQRLRFAAECQALARLAHPNVASLYEIGTTDDGHPFVAMEPVDGTAITTWCDRRRLGLRARIRLFLGVCAGVRHAHEKGILHRDLKPNNVLVTEVDGRPTAKVIDFGIARALDEPLISGDRLTLDHQIIGSPAYMSPEAAGGDKDVDTRSDVYALGLLLYRLLAGVLPFETKGETVATLLRLLAQADLPAPSVRLAGLEPDRRRQISAKRSLRGEKLTHEIRGDLDAIVGKAIIRDREQRYSSPGDLAADLERYLDHLPVEARSTGGRYRLGKFMRRNRVLVGAGMLVVVALVLGIVASSLALVRARQAEARARQDSSRAQQVVDDILSEVSESSLLEMPGAQPLRRQLLEQALHYYQGFIEEHGDDPSLQLQLALAHLRVGRILDDLGDRGDSASAYSRAIGMLEEADRAESLAPDDRYRLAAATLDLARAYDRIGQPQEAAVVGLRALRLQEELVEARPDDAAARRLLVEGLIDRADKLRTAGRYEAAVETAARAARLKRQLPDERTETPPR